LTAERPLADYFEKAVERCSLPKVLTNWILRDLLAYIKENKLDISDLKVSPEMMAEFAQLVNNGVVNSRVAQEVFTEMAATGRYPSIIIQEKGLEQIDSDEDVENIARAIFEASPGQVASFRNGNERIFGYFVGQAMKATDGKINPQKFQDAMRRLISDS